MIFKSFRLVLTANYFSSQIFSPYKKNLKMTSDSISVLLLLVNSSSARRTCTMGDDNEAGKDGRAKNQGLKMWKNLC